ncbi:hypothetical protein KAR28_03235, partial [Candidatus Parcubacteria bacterium]|nr:hypothetical protein [Candidatus Parcubacteria bacterium]
NPNMENFAEECEIGETLSCVTSDSYNGKLSCIVGECIWDDTCNPTESCGDGSVNGDEECDNADGTADNPADSSENNQYSCTTPPADTCEYTGGWCGDGIIQDGYGEECDPNETKTDYENRIGIVIDNATWIATQAACNDCAMSCVDIDGDSYGYPTNFNCAHVELDCDDRLSGADGILNTLDDGANINPGQPDDCTQYDGIDNDCDGMIDEHADTTEVLSNTDFETIDPASGFPVSWSGSGQIWADVSVVNTDAHSGTHSLLLHQNPNLVYPGTCSQDLCEGTGVYAAGDRYVYSNKCVWLAGTSQCDFDDSALCDWDGGQCIYNEGEDFDFFAYANRTMWLSFEYNVSSLAWEVGKMYITKFYYKGHSSGGFRPMMTYTLGHSRWCNEIASNWGSVNCAEGLLNDGTGIPTCVNEPTHCCWSHPFQTRCYEYLPMGTVSAGDYTIWLEHSTTFVYTDEMNTHLDTLGNLRNVIGASMGYNSTDALGTDLYIDDFQILECNNIDCDDNTDEDEDGIIACKDNCPDIFNPEQEDADGDEIGDFCDDCYNYGGSCVELTITQGVWTKTFRPYVKADTASEFYCYNGNCAIPYTVYPSSSNLAEAYDFTQSQRSNIFAYINANNNMLSLGFLHDYINDGSGGEVHFNFSGNGWDMSIVSVSDDGASEFSKIIHGNWSWATCCTDGGMIDIASLNTSWSITISPSSISGINSWITKSPGNEENIPNLTDPVIINYTAP